VEAITWWDFSDRGAWQGAAAGWLRKDMSPKPIYTKLHSLIKRDWWTRARGRTDAAGRWSNRAFYGIHRLDVRPESGVSKQEQISLTRNASGPLVITL
jgi:hypothetical protein